MCLHVPAAPINIQAVQTDMLRHTEFILDDIKIKAWGPAGLLVYTNV
jgi:hypothetical protein